jgi:hypothetical protein
MAKHAAPIIFLFVFPLLFAAADVAEAQVPPAADQIAAAVLAAPADLRDAATVLGYDPEGHLITLREGSNEIICLADEPGDDRFHVACYHRDLEPFMARGRELRMQEAPRDEVQRIRLEEIEAGKLRMPDQPTALYSLTGPADSFDAATGTVSGASPLYVVYIPYATPESTGLSPAPLPGVPWIMNPGTPWAHIMISPPRP